ncbi:MAG TPA: molybdate ABC transporter permease subunit [Alphaproteobacteria bacterium]|nr:molybdate ABC transporter permease subunit [Alphaproteobacteria bacterium]
MEWAPFLLSIRLAVATTVILIPLAVLCGRALARWRSPAKGLVEAALILPLVLPPTVLGFYLLVGFGRASPLGRGFEALFGAPLAFSFEGLVAASLIANIPFAVQPIQRACEALPREITDAAWVSGLSRGAAFWRIELPLIAPGLLSAAVLTFAHTMGEFGVVLMVGGNIPGETRTAAIALYDEVQIPGGTPGGLAAALLAVSFLSILAVQLLSRRGAS